MKHSNLCLFLRCASRGFKVGAGLAFCAALVSSVGQLAAAESTNLMVKPPVPLPGGLGLHPVLTSVIRTQDLVALEWFGIQGPYQVLHSTSANSNVWESIGQPTFRQRLNVSVPGETGFFRVLSGRATSTSETGGTLNYIGVASCVDCHEETVQEWVQTPHAHALQTLIDRGQENNPSCLVCHTVGFGTPLGFKDGATTGHLSGVQCENCHGPAANHIAVTRDISVRPKVTVAAEVCGGCHNFHHPTFDEWKTSHHSMTNADVSPAILLQGEPRMMTCGPCHSTAVRHALVEGLEEPGPVELPNRIDAAYFPVTCAACHDPHVNTPDLAPEGNPLLRNPLFSTNNFSYVPSTNVQSFALQYNQDIHLCGQCHNMRGARWQDTSRAPHHSPQYNILIGQGGFDLGQPMIAAHGSLIPTQCVRCHSKSLPGNPSADATAYASTNYFGHTMQIELQSCVECHISTRAAERAISRTQEDTKTEIAQVKALLDQWATSKAPEPLRSKYGTLAWEYNIPGDLSNTAEDANLRGPTTAEQAQIADAIKQARMNLYLVQYDGSFGVHNGTYARYLLSVAKDLVNSQLAQE